MELSDKAYSTLNLLRWFVLFRNAQDDVADDEAIQKACGEIAAYLAEVQQ